MVAGLVLIPIHTTYYPVPKGRATTIGTLHKYPGPTFH